MNHKFSKESKFNYSVFTHRLLVVVPLFTEVRTDSKKISIIHSVAEILEEDYNEDEVKILYRASSANDKYIDSLV